MKMIKYNVTCSSKFVFKNYRGPSHYRSLNPKIRFLCQKLCPQTDRLTHMNVNTEDTLSWRQFFFNLSSIINSDFYWFKTNIIKTNK